MIARAAFAGIASTLALVAVNSMAQPSVKPDFATHASGPAGNRFDQAVKGVFAKREADWRNGAIVYQVLPDRFVPSANLDAKRHLYPAPKVLRGWDETPKRGVYLESERLWSHEIEFWGGDLQSLSTRLDYIRGLGVDVLYLNPIHLAYTNHKYDAFDYQAISPEFGSRADFKALAAKTKTSGMKLVLDGVFNHMGRNAPKFKDAMANPASPWRDWFFFGPQYQSGARVWWLAENLPELNLDNAAVRRHVYAAPDSVVRSYLRDGADGWRLDVAVDMGFEFLSALTKAAHQQKPGSLVVGEIANYPKEWFPAVDAVMQFTLRELLLRTLSGELPPQVGMRMITRLIDEAGIEPMLKSWLMLDNHDLPRLATAMPNEAQRRLAQLLQFTLPGSPNLYYGSELGMVGGGDPEMRAPMRWDMATEANPELRWTRQLINLRKAQRALRVGNFRRVEAEQLIAFERYTDRARDTVVVLANPHAREVRETVMVANSKLMNNWAMVCQLSGQKLTIRTALLEVVLPAHGVLVLKPQLSPGGGYSAYKRVQ